MAHHDTGRVRGGDGIDNVCDVVVDPDAFVGLVEPLTNALQDGAIDATPRFAKRALTADQHQAPCQVPWGTRTTVG